MNLDDLLRLVGAPDATASDAAPRGVPATFGPRPQQPMPLAPPVAQPPNIPVPSAGDAVMGPAGPLERLAGRLPGNSIAGLLDLAGSLVRGHSAYADAARRASLNANDAALMEQHETLHEKRQAYQESVRQDRMDRLQKRIDTARADRDSYTKAGAVPGLPESELTRYKNAAAEIDRQMPEWEGALAKLSGEGLTATARPLGLPDTPVPVNYAADQEKARREALGRGIGEAEAPPKPDVSATDPADYLKKDRAVPYIDVSDVTVPKVHQKIVDYAKKNKLAIVDKKEKTALDLIDAARSGVASVLNDAQPFLPDKPLNAVAGAVNWLKGATRLDPNLASWKTNRLRAVEQVQAAAALGTGLRLNRDVIKAAAENDIPNEFDWKGSAAAKAQKLQSLYDALEGAILGDSGARERLIAAIQTDAAPQRPNPSAPLTGSRAAPASAPAAAVSDSVNINVPGKGIRRIARSLLPEAIRRGAKEVP